MFWNYLFCFVALFLAGRHFLHKTVDSVEKKAVEKFRIRESEDYLRRCKSLENYETEGFYKQLKDLTKQGNMMYPHIVHVLEINEKRRLGLLPYQQQKKKSYNRYYKHGYKR